MVCPFCKEEIRDDAIKCRYCGSSLLPLQPAADTAAPKALTAGDKTDKQVVYILDQGLLQFGKFVAGALAIFVVIGVYLYGIDVKESLKLIESSRTEIKKSSDTVTSLATDVEKTRGAVLDNQSRVSAMIVATEKDLATMKQESADIHSTDKETHETAQKVQAIGRKLDEESRRFDQDETRINLALDDAGKALAKINETKEKAIAAYTHSILASKPDEATEETETGTTPAPQTPAESASTAFNASFTPVQLAKLYNFPADRDGTGQTIGLIELGGGFEMNNLRAYFKSLGLSLPKIIVVPVDGGKNMPGGPNSADGQVQGDIEVAGAVAPGATIVVYFAPNTDQGFIDAIATAIHDDIHRLSVLSISWGGPESTWTKAAMQSMNIALSAANSSNITVLVASGDSGPNDGVNDGKPHVDFPASSPWVTAVGGTRLNVGQGGNPDEVPWDDQKSSQGASGRGVSSVFPLPAWQSGARVPTGPQGFSGRGMPDVVANASPGSGYVVRIDGRNVVQGGTAMSTPLWAGLIARLNQGRSHPIGFLNEILYTKLGPASALRPVGGPPRQWDPSAGWGSPDGQKLLAALR